MSPINAAVVARRRAHRREALVADKAPLAWEEFAADEARIALAAVALAGEALVALAAGALALGVESREPLLEEAEARWIARAAVALWTRGKDFTSMLSNLSDFPQLRVSTGSLGKSFSSPDGEERSIRRAYHAECKQLHPDRHVASGTAARARG